HRFEHRTQRAEQENANRHAEDGAAAAYPVPPQVFQDERNIFHGRSFRDASRNVFSPAAASTPFSRKRSVCARFAARGSCVTMMMVFLKSRFSVASSSRISSALRASRS